MRYTSTRSSDISVTFEKALCSGYSADGGLFVPERLPRISSEDLQVWSRLDYMALTFAILRHFIAVEEVADADLHQIIKDAFQGFENPQRAVPVNRVGQLYVAELWHGPTFCFKDLGMRGVVGLLSHFSTRRRQRTTLVVSTTGDTGPAAVQAVADLDNPLLTLLVHYPNGQISDFQRRQLTTVDSPYVKIAAYEGGGDDMDRPIKRMLATPSTYVRLTGVNSYNIGRPLLQMVHYVWIYLRVIQAEQLPIGTVIDIVLPTGAMGNIVGGYMAKQMGLPLRKLYAGVNANDITDRVIQTGAFHKAPLQKTLSEAINIQVPYNFERLLYYLTSQDRELVRCWMTEVDAEEKLDLDPTWLAKLRADFGSARIDDEELLQVIQRVREEHGYWLDPHSGVGWGAAEKLGLLEHAHPVALLSTASPCKFQEALEIAFGKAGWEEYRWTAFPALATAILEREEIAPALYKAKPGLSLEENQSEWEQLAWSLVNTFQQSS